MTDQEKATRAAYMRAYRKRKPEVHREYDRAKAERQRAKDPAKFQAAANERSRRYYERKKAERAAMTPEQLEAERVRKRAGAHARYERWKAKNPERVRALARESAARQYRANPEKFKDIIHRRRGKLKEGRVTKEDWAAILARYKHRCAYCRRGDVELTQDHVVPLKKGGRHAPDNVVPACRPCNTRKNDDLVPFPEPPAE
jgi:5-methylcytosine-specific restriction endonuclease McrA